MQIKVLSIHLTGNEQSFDFEQIMEQLPSSVKERIYKYRIPQERNLKIAGKGLLVKALKDAGVEPAQALSNLKYTATQQPYIDGLALQFSISHSEDLVACAVAKSAKIGLDVEKIKPVKLSLMQAYMDEVAWQEIINAPDPDGMFFHHWTIREAAIKASGFGLEQIELAEIKTTDDTIQLRNEMYHYKMLPLSHTHSSCLAGNHKIKEVEIVRLGLKDLL